MKSENEPFSWGSRLALLLGRGLLNLLARTWRFRVINGNTVGELRTAKRGFIFALWHGHLLPLLWYHRAQGVLGLRKNADQRRLINDLAASDVDDNGAAVEHGEPFIADQTVGFGNERSRDDQDVAAAERAVQFIGTGNAIDIKREDLRLKRFQQKAGMLFIFAVDASGSGINLTLVGAIFMITGGLALLLSITHWSPRRRVPLDPYVGRERVLTGTSRRFTR